MAQRTDVRRPKCYVAAKHVKVCDALSRSLEVGGSRGKGVTVVQLEKNGDLTRNMVVLRSGDHAKNGVVMNFCPFCGTNISDHLMKEEEPDEAAAG